MKKMGLLKKLKTLKSEGGAAARNLWIRLTRASAPERVLARLQAESLSFFDRTPPVGEKYPYEVHYAPTLQNVPEGLERFHLVGRNWRHNPDAPIALAFGFNAWKYGFIADYCPDVRIAFASRKFMGARARRAARELAAKVDRIYVWGYTDRPWIKRFARRRNIPLIRVEDGFLRSADLGANHATPYSLVFDSQGLYYNGSEPNDLADILANHDFAADSKLMEDAERVLGLLIKHRLLKYNLPDVTDSAAQYRIKTRPRVLVIGQVDNDAAVRMGNPDKWKMVDIVRLAKLENPNAEILYRPHPEVYLGFQKSKFQKKLVENFATIVSPEGSLVELLDTADQVYTISSLSGLEALIRGVKVTTLGTPFYAGWGTTDDRVAQPKGRILTPLEIFAGVYLLYPRYLSKAPTSAEKFEATTLRLTADRQLLAMSPEVVKAKCKISGFTWLHYALNSNSDKAYFENISQYEGIIHDISITKSSFAKTVFALSAMGAMSYDSQRSKFLQSVSKYLDLDSLRDIINIIVLSKNDMSIYGAVLTNYLKRYNPTALSKDFLAEIIENGNSSRVSERLPQEGGEILISEKPQLPLARMIESQMADADYHGAIQSAMRQLFVRPDTSTLLILSQLAVGKFAFFAAYEIACAVLSSGVQAGTEKATAIELATLGSKAGDKLMPTLVRYLVRRPEKILNAFQALERLSSENDLTQNKLLLTNTLDFNVGLSVRSAQSLLAQERPEEALEVARSLAELGHNSEQVSVVLSQALSACNDIAHARSLIKRTIQYHPTSLVYREALRLCILDNDYETGMMLLEECADRSIEIGDMLPRKIYFGARRIGDAFETFRKFHLRDDFIRHYGRAYAFHPTDTSFGKSIFLAAIFGPGDEIRWASIYRKLPNIISYQTISLSCDPRLLSLFSRSFPELNFVPVRRIRNTDEYCISDYNNVPHSSLVGVLDNVGHSAINSHKEVCLISDILGDALKCYDDFVRTEYLAADKEYVQKFKSMLPMDKPLIGISWRSSVVSHARNEHYLSIEQLSPLFALDGLHFVNLQYDDCKSELQWIKENFPGKMTDISDLDQFNDIDGVAALMSSLDLVISPATTVAELAGALGVPTWLLSNSSELHWRKFEGTMDDVWHGSMTHVEGHILQDKESLVQALVEKMNNWVIRNSHNRECYLIESVA